MQWTGGEFGESWLALLCARAMRIDRGGRHLRLAHFRRQPRPHGGNRRFGASAPGSVVKVGPGDIERYKACKLSEPLSPKTVNNHLVCLRRMLGVVAEWGLIEHVPRIKWLRTSDPESDFQSFEELGQLLATADWEWRTMIVLASKAGRRQGELSSLRRKHVDLAAGKLVVRQSVWKGIVGTRRVGERARSSCPRTRWRCSRRSGICAASSSSATPTARC